MLLALVLGCNIFNVLIFRETRQLQ